jgi:hypothetical protein
MILMMFLVAAGGGDAWRLGMMDNVRELRGKIFGFLIYFT